MKKTSKKTKRAAVKRKAVAKAPKLGIFGSIWKKIRSL